LFQLRALLDCHTGPIRDLNHLPECRIPTQAQASDAT
jgi:hypothetical protein